LIPSLFIPPFKVPSTQLVNEYKDKYIIKYSKKGYIVPLLIVHMKYSLINIYQNRCCCMFHVISFDTTNINIVRRDLSNDLVNLFVLPLNIPKISSSALPGNTLLQDIDIL